MLIEPITPKQHGFVVFRRQCKRCNRIFKTKIKGSRVCKKCRIEPFHLRK